MAVHTIKDFKKGDSVFHRSNSRITMIVIGTNEESGEVTCRWTDAAGNTQKEEFFAEELANTSEKTVPRVYSIKPKNYW